MLRVLLNDTASVTYTDAVLNQLITVAGATINSECPQDTDYTFDLTNSTISPDPTDDSFIVLVAHKAAIMILEADLRTKSSQGIKIVDGPSTIDLTSIVDNMTAALELLMAQYEKMKRDIALNNGGAGFGHVVVTPTTILYYSPNEFH